MSKPKGGKREGAGRPKGYKAIESEKAREYLTKRIAAELEPLADMILANAKNGDVKALEYVINQLVGKPRETIDMNEKVTLRLDT